MHPDTRYVLHQVAIGAAMVAWMFAITLPAMP